MLLVVLLFDGNEQSQVSTFLAAAVTNSLHNSAAHLFIFCGVRLVYLRSRGVRNFFPEKIRFIAKISWRHWPVSANNFARI
jgi:hypothetical protein